MEEQTVSLQPDKWRSLYQTAGYATIAMLVIIIIQILVFAVSPMPLRIEDWFDLFLRNWLLGLVHLDALYLINNGLIAGFLMVIPSTAGTLGLVFSLASLIPWYVFSILVAKKFIQLGRQRSGKELKDDTKLA